MKKYLIGTVLILAGIISYYYYSSNISTSENPKEESSEETVSETTRVFVNEYINQKEKGFEVSNDILPTINTITEVDLNNDGDLDLVVLAEGSYWCGTGGCTVLVFENKNGKYAEVASIPTSNSFSIKEKLTNEWKELNIISFGGGQGPLLETYVYQDGTYTNTETREIKA